MLFPKTVRSQHIISIHDRTWSGYINQRDVDLQEQYQVWILPDATLAYGDLEISWQRTSNIPNKARVARKLFFPLKATWLIATTHHSVSCIGIQRSGPIFFDTNCGGNSTQRKAIKNTWFPRLKSFLVRLRSSSTAKVSSYGVEEIDEGSNTIVWDCLAQVSAIYSWMKSVNIHREKKM